MAEQPNTMPRRRRDFDSNRTTPFRPNTPAANNANNRYAHRARYGGNEMPTEEELRRYPHRKKYYDNRAEYIEKEDEYNGNRCFPNRDEHFDENDNLDAVEDSNGLIGFYNQGTNRKDFLGLTWRHYFSFETPTGHECVGSWMTKKGHLTVDERDQMVKAQPGSRSREICVSRKRKTSGPQKWILSSIQCENEGRLQE
ncbi:unnamed protein product [Oikopleura dioica]|uniref:Uncharacterized protein n=1 Tax=Oikopleura dioica TaxID=34765 RepID=E4YRU6_OIKDI|nr:unnamed protein product [Oikopleura dioica]